MLVDPLVERPQRSTHLVERFLRVRDQLVEVAREYGAEEVVVVTITHDHEARRRSYELLAEAFGLRGASSGARAAA